MGTNILFWNCQGIVDVVALNETFFSKKHNFKIPGYDTIRNDRSTVQGGGVAFVVKNGLVVNKEYRNDDSDIITDNEALTIKLEISNNQNFTLATIYCPNGNPNLLLFQTINNLSDNVMFVGDFNSKTIIFRLRQEKHIWSYAQKYSKAAEPYLLK